MSGGEKVSGPEQGFVEGQVGDQRRVMWEGVRVNVGVVLERGL